ncbi:MAG: hypothetical protein QXL27_04660 [Candidatus Bathyarchaeia archaeon]
MSERLKVLENWLNRWISYVNEKYGLNLNNVEVEVFDDVPTEGGFELIMMRLENTVLLNREVLNWKNEEIKALMLKNLFTSLNPKDREVFLKAVDERDGREVYQKLLKLTQSGKFWRSFLHFFR